MYQRDPEKKLSQIINPDDIQPTSTTDWKQYKFTLLTPMFGGGTKTNTPDTGMPVRATACRGQLRYWWRFLAKNREKGPDTGKKIFDKERKIWGGLAEDGKDYSSRVKLRVTNVAFNERTDSAACAEYIKYQNGHQRAGQYKSTPKTHREIPEYAMFPGRGNLKSSTEIEKEPANMIVTLSFILEISYWNDDCRKLFEKEVTEALCWWATFGGLGARTRRGCGSVYSPNLKTITEQEAKSNNCLLVFSADNSYESATAAWKKAVQHLQDFRQTPTIGRENGTEHPGCSLWPEPDSIREIADTYSTDHTPKHPARIAFPRAVFGLPIIFKFKNDSNVPQPDPQQTELKPQDGDRLASPLILLPYPVTVGKGNIRYKPAALCLPSTHLDAITLQLSYSRGGSILSCPGSKLTGRKNKDWDQWEKNWWHPDKATSVKPISRNGGKNALDAFMTFFKKGGRNDE
jgi:CRISPR-associated protein Cmr1